MGEEITDNGVIIKNAGFLYFGEFINQILSLILVIAISRKLGDVGLGKYSFAFSFASLFLLITDFGLQTWITKEVAKNKSNVNDHLSKTFTLKIVLNVLTLLITTIIVFFSKKDIETIVLVILAAISLNFYYLGGVFRSVLQGYETMKYEVISKIIERVIAASIGVFLLLRGYGIFSLFFVLISSNVIYYIILHWFIIKKIGNVSIKIDYAYWKKTLIESMPFWLTLIFINIYFRIDTIMLSYMKNYAETGWYNAAYKILDVLTKVPFILIIAVFPALTRLNTASHEKTRNIYEKSLYYLIVLGIPMTTGLVILSDRIILFIYGAQFMQSILALKILSCALFFIFVNYLMGYLLNSIDKQKLFTLTTGITTIFNIILNFLLIPLYGYIGAGISTVASQIVNFAFLYYFTKKNNFHINFLRLSARPLIASIFMLIMLHYLRSLNLILLSILGVISYFCMLILIKGIPKEDLNNIKLFKIFKV